eukprot:12892713-Prorocentrum_lima.AAC.1
MPPRSTRGEVENGRGDASRSRSTSPSPHAGHTGLAQSMLTGWNGSSAQGYEPNRAELELVHAQHFRISTPR